MFTSAARIAVIVCNAGSLIRKLVLNILRENLMALVPVTDATIGPNQTSIPFTVIASDSKTGDILTLPTEVTVDDSSIATVETNPDGTGRLTRVSAEATGTVTLTATVTNPDGTTVSATATVDVSVTVATPENADTVEITFGTPE